MWNFKQLLLLLLYAAFSHCNAWIIFPILPETTSLQNYTSQKVSTLKHLRNVLLEKVSNKNKNTSQNHNSESFVKVPETLDSTVELTKTEKRDTNPKDIQFWKFASGVADKMLLSSKESRDGFLQQILPNRDFLKKISDFREKLEPEVKKYFTDKYNSFLNNLVPYSETIGVPPYVLNSLKIPQNFDPRWQFIQSILDSSHEKLHVHNSSENLSSLSPDHYTNEVQGRSDDQDLVSDQEPDATSKGQKKYQHIYLSPRTRPRKAYLSPDRTSGYEISFDSVGQYGQDVYDTNTYTKGYYLDEYPYATKNDLLQAAGHHVARGHSRGDYGHHGGGYGGGGGHGHGGLMDPFTILGGLAFLTYLGLLIQQSLNGTGGMGRSLSDDTSSWEIGERMRKIPVVLTRLSLHENENSSQSTEIETQKSFNPPITSSSHVTQEQKNSTLITVQKLNELGMNSTNSNSVNNNKKPTDYHECRLMCQIKKKLQSVHQPQQQGSQALRRIQTSGQVQNG